MNFDILRFSPKSDPKNIISVSPNFVVLKSRCPLCGARMIENAKYIECGGNREFDCNYIEGVSPMNLVHTTQLTFPNNCDTIAVDQESKDS